MELIGDVKGRDVVLVDDIIDTGSTITKAAKMMMENGAKSVRAVCTHPILSGSAIEKIENSPFEEFIITDSIPLRRQSDKIKVLSTARLFADVIKRVNNHQSISSHFEFTTIL
jgi:ribose-phosphate pyrophosphokinase